MHAYTNRDAWETLREKDMVEDQLLEQKILKPNFVPEPPILEISSKVRKSTRCETSGYQMSFGFVWPASCFDDTIHIITVYILQETTVYYWFVLVASAVVMVGIITQ